MLQLLAFTISTVSCGLSPSLNGFPGLHHRENNRTWKEIKYVDLLSSNKNPSDDAITTIYGSIPALETQVTSPEAYFRRRQGDNDFNEAREYLVTAIEKFKDSSVLDSLAVEYLLKLFNDFIKRSRDVGNCVDVEFNYSGREMLNSPPCEVAAALINARAYRALFGIWLKRMSKKLAGKCGSVSSKSENITLTQLYAVYSKIVVDTLLAKVNTDRLTSGQDPENVTVKYFVAIPKNNVSNGLANPILNVDTMVNPSSIEK